MKPSPMLRVSLLLVFTSSKTIKHLQNMTLRKHIKKVADLCC